MCEIALESAIVTMAFEKFCQQNIRIIIELIYGYRFQEMATPLSTEI